MKILVCDDLPARCKDVINSIKAGAPSGTAIESLVGDEFTAALKALFKQVAQCLKDPRGYKPSTGIAFENFDVVFIDNNLTNLDIKGTRLTAESIAGYIRAFTSGSYVVSLNKNPEVDFDLRFLVGDYATRADLALNAKHLSNPSLWTGSQAKTKHDFLPWYWPALREVGDRRRRQVEFVKKNLKRSIANSLGFPKKAIEFLSRHAKGALSPSARLDSDRGDGGPHFKEIKFIDLFIASSRSLPHLIEERKPLSAHLRNKHVVDIVARSIASDVDLWMRRDVVAPQEALVDLPHLLLRMPFLLGDNVNKFTAWNDPIAVEGAPYGLASKLFSKYLAASKFEHDVWVRSPSFWWSELRDSKPLNDLFSASKISWPTVVFCEDISKFDLNDDTKAANPKEFVAELEGSWTRRHVKQLRGYKYAPRSRFAL